MSDAPGKKSLVSIGDISDKRISYPELWCKFGDSYFTTDG